MSMCVVFVYMMYGYIILGHMSTHKRPYMRLYTLSWDDGWMVINVGFSSKMFVKEVPPISI